VSKPTTLASLLIPALLVAACGDRPPEKKAATQVAAKVNGGEISVHQVNFLLQKAPNIPASQVDIAKRQALESLIDQELAVQQALDAKLERTPNVMQAMETARREILSRAYLEQTVAKVGKPSADDVRKFYGEHPELFSGRKVYRMEEVVFGATPEILGNVKQWLGQGKSVADIVSQLRANGVEVGGGVVVKPAEQLALEMLPKIAQAREGQPMLFETSGKAALLTVLAAKAEPMDEAKAMPFIETYLANKQKTELARDTIKQLREKAKVEYVGEFAGTQAATPTAPAVQEKTAGNGNDTAVSKGIAGLK